MNVVYDFGLTLKNLRKKKNLSQEQVAKRLNLTKSSIGGYENNIITPSLEILKEFAILFNTSADYLLGLDKSESVVIDGLTPRQKEIIEILILEFKTQNNR